MRIWLTWGVSIVIVLILRKGINMVGVLLLVGFGLMGTALCGLIWQNSLLRKEKRVLYERIEFMQHMDRYTLADLRSQIKLQAIRLRERF
jgi:hypothetical protein